MQKRCNDESSEPDKLYWDDRKTILLLCGAALLPGGHGHLSVHWCSLESDSRRRQITLKRKPLCTTTGSRVCKRDELGDSGV